MTEIQALGYQTIASLTTAGYKTAADTLTDVAAVGYQTLATLTTNGYKTVANTLTDVATAHHTKTYINAELNAIYNRTGTFAATILNGNITALENKTYKAKGSVQHTGGSSGTGTLLNEVNINSTFTIPNSLFNLNNYRNYSTTSYHSWYIFYFTFATALTSLEYQVALTDADQNNNAVAVGNIMSIALKDKSLTGFQVAVVVYEPSATSAQNFGFDFVVI